MRVGIYAQVCRDAKPTGIGLHVRELVTALGQLDDRNEYLLYYPAFGSVGAEPFPDLKLPANFRPRRVRFPAGWVDKHPRLWWWYLARVLSADRVDVFHGPNHFLPNYRRGRTVVTIHDVAYFKMTVHGEGMDQVMRDWTRRALDCADATIALSENTRQDVQDLGYPADRIRVIYGGGRVVPADLIQTHRVDEMRQALKLPERFVLFVGTLQPRKNVPFLIRAYAKLKQTHPVPQKLVLAGHRGESGDEVDALVQQLGLQDDVQITGYVEAWHLPLLYKLADAFVLPTRYEGFTLVTIEAMAYGTPVIATDTSSVREGVGDAARLVLVDDDDALAAALKDVLTDDAVRSQLIAAGRERAALFTWQNNARQTWALYDDLATGKLPPRTRR